MLSQQSHRISKEPSFLDLSTLSLSVFGKDLTRIRAAVYIATDQIFVNFLSFDKKIIYAQPWV